MSHHFVEHRMYADVCAARDNGRMCGAPMVHPWHGHDEEEVMVAPKKRRRRHPNGDLVQRAEVSS